MVITQYNYIVKDMEHCAGMARIVDTSMPVASIVLMQRRGASLEGIVAAYPEGYLSLSKVHAALAYYYDHPDEVEQDIVKLTNPPAGFTVGKNGVLQKE